MNSARNIAPLLVCLGCGIGVSAQAADDGWYAVAFGGQSSATGASQSATDELIIEAFSLAGLAVVDATSNLDDTDTAFGAAIGYQVTNNFAAELSYVDLGSVDYRATGTVTDGISEFPTSVGINASARGPVFSLLGILPFADRFSVFGRVGLALLDTEGSVRVTIDDVTDNVSDSTQRSNGLYGIGVEYSAGERFGIRLELARYADVGSDEITGETDIDLATLGVRYSFD